MTTSSDIPDHDHKGNTGESANKVECVLQRAQPIPQQFACCHALNIDETVSHDDATFEQTMGSELYRLLSTKASLAPFGN